MKYKNNVIIETSNIVKKKIIKIFQNISYSLFNFHSQFLVFNYIFLFFMELLQKGALINLKKSLINFKLPSL